jgi:translation initiation factor 2 alpha subunit (eIF-2alpha)
VRLNRKNTGSIAAQRAKKASKAIIGQCKSKGISYSEMVSALTNYLNDRFNLSLGALTAEEASNILTSKGVKPETAEKIKELVRQMEDAVYTGRGGATCSLIGEIPECINKIEKEIR